MELTFGRLPTAPPWPARMSDSQPLPPASFSSLPIEIKARIVELAHLQDDRYKARLTTRNPAGESNLLEFHLVSLAQNAWHGRSVSALAETNKELNAVAARYLFRVRPSTPLPLRRPRPYTLLTQVLTDRNGHFAPSSLPLHILPRHVSQLRVLALVDKYASAPDLRNAFAAVRLLPKLRELCLVRECALSLFEPLQLLDPTSARPKPVGEEEWIGQRLESEEQALARTIVVDDLRHVGWLELAGFLEEEIVLLLRSFPSLRTPKPNTFDAGGKAHRCPLGPALVKVGTLRHLVLGAGTAGALGPEWVAGA